MVMTTAKTDWLITAQEEENITMLEKAVEITHTHEVVQSEEK